MNYLGLDIGTSGCKAVVFDDQGRPQAVAHREYDLILTPDGGAELNSDDVIRHCLAVIAEARQKVAPGSVKALSVSSQGEAFTAIGPGGQALCNAMVSSDTRARDFARDWPPSFGEKRLYEITGHTAHPLFTLFKLLWLRDRKPEVWDRAEKFLCFEDLMYQRLGLEPVISWSLAGRTMLFDVRRHEWSPEILKAIGLSPDKLARPVASGTVVGRTADGLLVVAGGHDQPCGALGAGATESGMAMYATGSVECITPAFDQPVFTEALRRNNICTYDHAVAGMYATVVYCLTGGNILKWFRDEFGAAEVAAARARGISPYELLLEQMSPEPTRLLVLPYWTPSGTPYFDLTTPGAILGLRLSTKRGDILRALLEGVAFEMRLNLDLLQDAGCRIRELRAIGGGAQSKAWTRLKSDVLGRPIATLDVTEAGCLGVALLAAAADLGASVRDLAARWVHTGAVIEPDPARHRFYTERFARYRRLQPLLQEFESAPSRPALSEREAK